MESLVLALIHSHRRTKGPPGLMSLSDWRITFTTNTLWEDLRFNPGIFWSRNYLIPPSLLIPVSWKNKRFLINWGSNPGPLREAVTLPIRYNEGLTISLPLKKFLHIHIHFTKRSISVYVFPTYFVIEYFTIAEKKHIFPTYTGIEDFTKCSISLYVFPTYTESASVVSG